MSSDIHVCEFLPEKRQAMKEYIAIIVFFPKQEYRE